MSTETVPFSGKQINQDDLLDIMSKDRRDEFKVGVRERLSSISKSIKINALMALVERQCNGWPEGLLPNGTNTERTHIWEKILEFVEEPQDIINMSAMCDPIRSLLQEKYRAARLSEAVEICVKKAILPPRNLLDLRLVCRTSKSFFNKVIMNGKVDEDGHVTYLIRGFVLWLDNFGDDLPRLHQITPGKIVRNRSFLLRQVILYDFLTTEIEDLLPPLVWDSIHKLFEFAGDTIQSLVYHSNENQSQHDTYNRLREWVSMLPNLEEISVSVYNTSEVAIFKPFEPFPTVSMLKRYLEDTGLNGLSLCYVAEILRANPTINFVHFSSTPENRSNVLVTEGILKNHPLEVFLQASGESLLLQRQLNWPLRRMEIIMYESVPAGTFFDFVNQFDKTLQDLSASVKLSNNDTGGTMMLSLPNLTKLDWRLENDSQLLHFMIPLKKLQFLDISLSCRSQLKGEGILKHLETCHIPMLYPAMRRIQAGGALTTH